MVIYFNAQKKNNIDFVETAGVQILPFFRNLFLVCSDYLEKY